MRLIKRISLLSELFYKHQDNWILTIFWNSLYTAFFLLPLGINLPTPFFIVSILLGLIHIFRFKKKFKIDDKALLLFPLYFVIMVCSLLYTENLSAGIALVQRSLSLLFFPIIFLFVKEDASTVKKLFEFLLYGLILSFFLNFVLACYTVVGIINTEMSSLEMSAEGMSLLMYTLSDGLTNFLGAEFSSLVNPNYVSLYILLVLSYYLKNQLQSRLQAFIVFILFLYLFLLASIAAYLILFIVSIMLISKITNKSQKYTMVLMFFLGCIVFLQNPRVFDFYTNVTSIDRTLEIDNTSIERSRLLTWDASIKLIAKAPIFGYGIGDTNTVLVEKYKDLNYVLNYQNQYNAHNQFLQTFLQTGIIGFAVLLNVFIVLAFRMNRSRNEIAVFVILFISLFFESMLVRFNGIVFFSIVIPLLLKKRSILSSRIIRNDAATKEF
ncbi:O-antigen ligase family protein [Aquimarina sp. U1-2]|uniref:O-antigen ligase family protein n=1 Tax=Aquimarina sp. U1-2 TaxID=2823141 RepID=UPI001AEC8688|nr:O-antigen ligase family protein [Aquimarina sp. U1-2]MBP2833273.1 O-antigen ligase family protein [Aquimarina sp. U1-2]